MDKMVLLLFLFSPFYLYKNYLNSVSIICYNKTFKLIWSVYQSYGNPCTNRKSKHVWKSLKNFFSKLFFKTIFLKIKIFYFIFYIFFSYFTNSNQCNDIIKLIMEIKITMMFRKDYKNEYFWKYNNDNFTFLFIEI